MPMHPFNEQDAALFKDVKFIVEATDFEYLCLWKESKVKWEEDLRGHRVEIGEVGNMPVCVSIRYAILNGSKVMFYEAVSAVVDHNMVREWLEHWGKDIKWDNGYRWAHTDAMNFGHCLHALERQ